MQKEVAITMAIIMANRSKDTHYLNDLDKGYDLAVEFVNKYGLEDQQWEDKDWEETICEFIKDRI